MSETILDRLLELLGRIGRHTSPDQEAPFVVLWPDPDREFEGVIPRVRAGFPVVTVGRYDPESQMGPAIWVRCVLAGTVPGLECVPERPFVVYLPGWSRDNIRDIAEGSDELRPLADLQFRGVVWLQRGTREWTGRSLLGGSGLDLKIAGDRATREAMLRAFPRLLDEPMDDLRHRGELDSQFFNELLAPDHERLLLLWLNDPTGTESGTDPVQWSAFRATCRKTYRFDPETDGPVAAARLLGDRRGAWAKVWAAFEDVPERYSSIPERLRAAQPEELLPEPHSSWPVVNEHAENNLRGALEGFGQLSVAEAAGMVRELDAAHGERRSWVWARLGMAPLALSLQYLVELANRCETPLGGTSADEIGKSFAAEGWKTDRAAVEALAAVEPGPDGDAVGIAVRALYEGWLDGAARRLQALIAETIPAIVLGEYPAGTCVLFIDGLRFDVAKMVEEQLGDTVETVLEWNFAAIPTVTPTAKPAVSPVADRLFPGPKLSPSASRGGAALSLDGLRKALEEAGWQVPGDGGWGNPAGRSWIEGGDIDKQGHNLSMKLPHRLHSEARQIAEQIRDLLGWGWSQVIVVTDHGWLHLPGGLPKVELPINTVELRKGRCARIPADAKVEHLTLPWRWDPAVRIVVAPGIGCYEAGKVYEHGGISPQECVTPRLVVRTAGPVAPTARMASISSLTWVGMRCRIEAEAPEGANVDIRTKPADAASSIASEPRPLAGGKCSLLVPDDRLDGTTATVVILDDTGTIAAQRHTTVGGSDNS